MNISRVDLNLLVYLDVLLRECNVTRAAEELGISQPALSNSLRRLRDLFNDPILVRTSDGMTPTDRALELQPLVRNVLAAAEQAILPKTDFDPMGSNRIFRVHPVAGTVAQSPQGSAWYPLGHYDSQRCQLS
jgi:DNA-binding transcriptional LysR family regulator